MPMIIANVILTKTVAVLDGPTIATILTWLQVNIKNQLPADTTATITFTINP